MNDYDEAIERVEKAQTPGELFETISTGSADPTREYKYLARLIHPDRCPDDRERAEKGFAKLSEFWVLYRDGKTPRSDTTIMMNTKRRNYVMDRAHTWSGDLCSIYRARYNEDDEMHDAVLKIPRSPKNSDLMRVEAMNLKHIAFEGEERFAAYVPRHVESFKHRDSTDGKERLVNVLEMPRGLYSLQEVYDAFPDGVGPRDVAWMWRRLLVALGYVHGAGRVHGALTPDHILIHPEEHGLVLVDWCYSVEVGSPLKAIVPKHRDLYPLSALDKEDVTGNLDIRMGTQSLLHILRGRVPRQYKGFLKYSAQSEDAFQLREEYDQLLEEMFGPRRFVPFEMPRSHMRSN